MTEFRRTVSSVLYEAGLTIGWIAVGLTIGFAASAVTDGVTGSPTLHALAALAVVGVVAVAIWGAVAGARRWRRG